MFDNISALRYILLSPTINDDNRLFNYIVINTNGEYLMYGDTNGKTPLHLALLCGNIDAAKTLIKQTTARNPITIEELLNIKDKNGETATDILEKLDDTKQHLLRTALEELSAKEAARSNTYS